MIELYEAVEEEEEILGMLRAGYASLQGEQSHWQAYNLSKQRTYKELEELFSEGCFRKDCGCSNKKESLDFYDFVLFS
ncbi:hypothetical protein [Bacillus sp. 2205SS5-2]|uniref:hypothetical protein n=1 Tax=Bacillus sp. 2205SS5-2 TaxID=3109031 RepID=UPI003007261E